MLCSWFDCKYINQSQAINFNKPTKILCWLIQNQITQLNILGQHLHGMHLICTNFLHYYRKITFGCKFSIIGRKNMPQLHLLKVLFWINLVSNISIKASKKVLYLMPNEHFFGADLMHIIVGKKYELKTSLYFLPIC